MSILEWMRKAEFTEYEAKAYFTLIKYGEMTASKLSRASGIPYSKTYEIVSKLEGKGLIEVQKARPMIFRAVPPRISLPRYEQELIRGLEREHSERMQSLEDSYTAKVSQVTETLRIASEKLQALFDDRGDLESSDDMIWTIRNRENVLSQIRELIMGASTIKLILPEKLLRRMGKEIKSTRAKGEIIVENEKLRGSEFPENFRVYSMERIPFKCGVLIADDERTIFTSENLEMGFKSSNPGLATILNHIFEHEKEEAKLEQESS